MRLFRPHIPVEVRCRVALRQLGEMWPDRVIEEYRLDRTVAPTHRKSHGKLLADLLHKMGDLLGCDVVDLRLDHDPPLAARPQFRRGLGKKVYYQPDANDPEHLRYRPHGPEFEGSHLIKTNIRGDHGQHPDRVLIKRARKRQKRAKKFRKLFPPQRNPWPKGRKIENRRRP